MAWIHVKDRAGTDPSSRIVAAGFREEIEKHPQSIVDMNGVLSISHSFADELLAVLVSQRGEEWFRENIRVIGMSPEVRQEVLAAISLRLA